LPPVKTVNASRHKYDASPGAWEANRISRYINFAVFRTDQATVVEYILSDTARYVQVIRPGVRLEGRRRDIPDYSSKKIESGAQGGIKSPTPAISMQ
jgi:hypothetical protein